MALPQLTQTGALRRRRLHERYDVGGPVTQPALHSQGDGAVPTQDVTKTHWGKSRGAHPKLDLSDSSASREQHARANQSL